MARWTAIALLCFFSIAGVVVGYGAFLVKTYGPETSVEAVVEKDVHNIVAYTLRPDGDVHYYFSIDDALVYLEQELLLCNINLHSPGTSPPSSYPFRPDRTADTH